MCCRPSTSKFPTLTTVQVKMHILKLMAFGSDTTHLSQIAVIITYSRQSLNQILIMENVQLLKSQSGISSSNIHDDPTNSAAQLAHNAIRIVQMGRAVPGGLPPPGMHPEGPARQSVSTPFGYLPTYGSSFRL